MLEQCPKGIGSNYVYIFRNAFHPLSPHIIQCSS